MASTRLRLETAEPELANRVRTLIVEMGLKRAAEELGMGSAAATNIAAMVPVQRGTLALAREWTGIARTQRMEPVEAPAPKSAPRQIAAQRPPPPPAVAYPDPEGMAKSLQAATRTLCWTPAIPWRIKVGRKQTNGETPVMLDFSECSRPWGCTIEAAESYAQLLAHVNDEVMSDPACWTTDYPDTPFTRLAKYAAKLVCDTHESMTGAAVATKEPETPPEILEMERKATAEAARQEELQRQRVEFERMADEAAARDAEVKRLEAEQIATAEAMARPKPEPQTNLSEEEAEAERAELIAQAESGETPRRKARRL